MLLSPWLVGVGATLSLACMRCCAQLDTALGDYNIFVGIRRCDASSDLNTDPVSTGAWVCCACVHRLGLLVQCVVTGGGQPPLVFPLPLLPLPCMRP